MAVPKSLLRGLYLRGSLRNLDIDGDGKPDAFSFSIRNTLAPVNVSAPLAVKVDATEYPPSAITLRVGETVVKGSDITPERTLLVKVGYEIAFTIESESGLPPGKHTIEISVDTMEAGKISFDVEDELI
ncbi:TPA: hypothetical protein EYP44_05160 [Candidatus Bathyarchaeota archaeon]|nr:hypothetical protein [Candidatus Bathyarchaeota archaeon]